VGWWVAVEIGAKTRQVASSGWWLKSGIGRLRSTGHSMLCPYEEVGWLR